MSRQPREKRISAGILLKHNSPDTPAVDLFPLRRNFISPGALRGELKRYEAEKCGEKEATCSIQFSPGDTNRTVIIVSAGE